MRSILNYALAPEQAGLWFLGQAGYVLRACGRTVAIDPYLSDSVAKISRECARVLPVPLEPEALDVDLFIVTHDHLDHLDPETVTRYRHKDRTLFVAPRLAARKLLSLGIAPDNIRRIDAGESAVVRDVAITGVYAVPTDPGVVDTTGYRLEFPNGRSVYHTSDTAFSELLLEAAPGADVLLVCINGKWGNLNVRDAARLAARVKPSVAIPNHYDMMRINSEDPEAFARRMREDAGPVAVRILYVMDPFVW